MPPSLKLDLDATISRFWEVEEVPTDEGRYVVALPFKSKFSTDLNLGPSQKGALAQFLRNESRMLRNPEVKDQYDEVIEKYLTLGHMSRIEPPQ